MATMNLMLDTNPLPLDSLADGLVNSLGINLFDEEIDNVIIQTNEFLTDPTFIGQSGPFWWIMEMCMCLGALFALIMAAGMTYKMMVKGEPFDVLKVLRVLGIALVMYSWYPSTNANGSQGGSVLGMLSYIPNCIGSYTHDLYQIEAAQVQENYNRLAEPLEQREDTIARYETIATTIINSFKSQDDAKVISEFSEYKTLEEEQKKAVEFYLKSSMASLIVHADKLIMCLSIMLFRIGWWGTMFCQQILLGMLTIFGPIQWAFSILPKWEGAWAKWISRYLTVHFYGAMLYFVGFYVLLLFDIVISIQYDNLQTMLQAGFSGIVQNTFLTSVYLLVASLVALKCLNIVPDLASWMIPEGDTSFSTRNFGEGVAEGVKGSAMRIVGMR